MGTLWHGLYCKEREYVEGECDDQKRLRLKEYNDNAS